MCPWDAPLIAKVAVAADQPAAPVSAVSYGEIASINANGGREIVGSNSVLPAMLVASPEFVPARPGAVAEDLLLGCAFSVCESLAGCVASALGIAEPDEDR